MNITNPARHASGPEKVQMCDLDVTAFLEQLRQKGFDDGGGASIGGSNEPQVLQNEMTF